LPVENTTQLEAVIGAPYEERMMSRLRPLITAALVKEHERDPFGDRSDALRRVLTYLGNLPIDGKLIVEHDGAEHWYVCRLCGFPPVRVDRIEGPFATETAAIHAVFVRRLREVFGIELDT
jgi:hypothetical protein